MRILVDMDNVICDFTSRILEWHNKDHGTNYVLDDCTIFEIEKCTSISKDFIRSCMRCPEFFRNLDPLPGAIEGIKRLQELGHDVIIATAVPRCAGIAYHGKLEWIRQNMPFFNLDNFISISRKYLLQGDVLIDDGEHNLYDWWVHAHNDTEAIVFDQPWNRGRKIRMLRRFHGWGEIVKQFESQEFDPGSHPYGVTKRVVANAS